MRKNLLSGFTFDGLRSILGVCFCMFSLAASGQCLQAPAVTTTLTIVLDESMDANTLLQVLDQQGRCVFTQAIKHSSNQTITIDVSRWTAGTYFVRIVNDSGAIVKKLILR